jgi:hypothetical protein
MFTEEIIPYGNTFTSNITDNFLFFVDYKIPITINYEQTILQSLL